MAVKLLEQNNIEVGYLDGAEFHHLCTGGNSGIVKGVSGNCSLTRLTSNRVVMYQGLIILQGFRIRITENIDFSFTSVPAVKTTYYIQVHLSVKPDSVSAEILLTDTPKTSVADIMANGYGEAYLTLYSFDIDSNDIFNLVRVAPLLQSLQTSDIEANPKQNPTQKLETIRVKNTVYSLPQGSGGNVDLTPYQKKIDNSLETKSKEIVGAINETNNKFEEINNKVDNLDLSSYQSKTDETLETESKEIVGAINEVNAKAEQGADIDLSEYVKFTDYPNSIVGRKAGVIKIDNYYGFTIGTAGSLGVLIPLWATNNNINNRTNNTFLSSHTLDYAIVKGITTNKNTLTDEEKAIVQTWLGVKTLYTHHISFELFGRNNSTYKCKLVYLSNSNVAFESGKAFYDEARNSGFVGSARDPNTLDTAIVTLDNMFYAGDYYTICFDQNGGFIADMNDIDGAGEISISNFTDTVL